MKEIRFHGRRLPRYDHTAPFVEAARLLAQAALAEGKQVQLRPPWLFLRGYSPEVAHLRVDTEPIETYSQEYILDLVAVTDATILTEVKVSTGLKENGVLLVNSNSPVSVNTRARVVVADLSGIAGQFRVDLAIPVAAAAAALSRVVDRKALSQFLQVKNRDAARRQLLQALQAASQAVGVRAK
ncbi:MAG: 2-oxoacid:acceptor oxidoreductase family protein [Candidatus Methylomirabilales bacterium]